MCSSAQHASSASPALSIAEAPPPIMSTRLPRSDAKSMSSDVCAQKRRGTSRMKSGMRSDPSPSRPVAITTLRARMRVPPASSSASRPSSGAMRNTSMPFSTGSASTLAVPAQVVHPHDARDLVERLPCRRTELRDKPGAEGERRNAGRRSGQHLRRAQRLHPRVGHPRPLDAGGTAVETADVANAVAQQREGQHQPGHAGADHHDIADRIAARHASPAPPSSPADSSGRPGRSEPAARGRRARPIGPIKTGRCRNAATAGFAFSAASSCSVGNCGRSRIAFTMQRKPSGSPSVARNWCQVQDGMVTRSNGFTARTSSPTRHLPWPRRIITACMCSWRSSVE